MPRRTSEEIISLMREHAFKQGGECLSTSASNNSSRINFKCSEGHEWDTSVASILYPKTWCPKCVGQKISAIKREVWAEKMKSRLIKRAKEKGGILISNKYFNNSHKMEFKCSKGHHFYSTPTSILDQNTWCPLCLNKLPKEDALKRLKIFAKTKGGECLSKKYVDAKTKYLWKCDKGHKWSSTSDSVVNNNTWCPKCALDNMGETHGYLNEEFIKNVCNEEANKKGGSVIKYELRFSRSRKRHYVQYICQKGHKWWSVHHAIFDGVWCPTCSKGVSERITKLVFEKITGKTFYKCFPKWLKNSLGNKMELDGYNEELSIAFEYHGEQHYKEIKFFHKGRKSFERRVKDDELKRSQCEERGITLIEVPYYLEHEEIQEFVTEKLINEANLSRDKLKTEKIELSEEDVHPENMILKLRAIAKSYGGELLSNVYINNNTKLKWRCSEGHEWEAVSASIINNKSWCKICRFVQMGKNKATPDKEIKKLVESKGGKLINIERLPKEGTKLSIECKFGHRWDTARLHHIKKGIWCPKCGQKKLAEHFKDSLEIFQEIAKDKGGKCLSDSYINQRHKLKFECSEGHQWDGRPQSIKQGSWCPHCRKNNR